MKVVNVPLIDFVGREEINLDKGRDRGPEYRIEYWGLVDLPHSVRFGSHSKLYRLW